MVASEGGDGGGIGIECCVGTIVWVRRRNGSWWPGRILGQQELSASHLMSPRSGTPVKLLGREDASVDWYNLEKSKRVKAFRCGEFDACIEKAEASMGVPIKKREKYARREDAILHALELEKKQLEMMEQKPTTILNGTVGKPLDTLKRESNDLSASDLFTKNNESSIQGQYAVPKSPMLPRRANLLQEEDITNDSTDINNQNNSKQKQLDEHISEAIPRMRGLQDFGLRTAPKKKLPQSAAWLTTKKAAESNSNALPITGSILATGHTSMSKDILATKKKRSYSGLTEESLVKKRDRRRPLLQVLQSSAKLQVSHSSQLDHYPPIHLKPREKIHTGATFQEKGSRCIYLPVASVDSQDNGEYSSEETETTADQFGMHNCFNQSGSFAENCTSSGMLETNESDSSLRNYLEAEEGDMLRDTGRSLAYGTKDCDRSSCFATDKLGEVNNDEVPFSCYMSDLQPYEHPADTFAEAGVSKWHMKGKRNIRNLIKRSSDVMDEKIRATGSDKCKLPVMEAAFETKNSSLKMEIGPSSQRSAGQCHIKKEDHYDSDNLIGEDFIAAQMKGYSDQRRPSISKTATDVRGSHIGFKNLESDSHLMSTSGLEAPPTHGAQRKHREESEPVNDTRTGRGTGFILFDVNLNVKASYQGERVPLVSLMSRFNGKAIVGHPVQIEILDDSTSLYLSGNYYPDDCTAPQPVWTTARRTSMQRVPRSNPGTSTLDDDDAGASQYSVREKEQPPGISYGHSKNKSKFLKKKSYHSHRSPSGRFQKKSLKTISLSSQKTRTLSSFANEHQLGAEKGVTKLARSSNIMIGSTKQEPSVPLVTCVPLKVAFSRILEAVGRPSSSTVTRNLPTLDPPIREPS